MKKGFVILALLTAFFISPIAQKASYGQMNILKGQSKVEAEPNKEYVLKDSDGLWFIMAKKFSGPESRKKANQLAYELRKRYKFPAYIFKYDLDQGDINQLSRESGIKYRYQTAPPKEYAVLVGSFPAIDDPGLQKALLSIKRSKPDSLKNDEDSQRLTRQFETLAKKNKEYAGFGPLGGALAVPNPLIPKDYFAQKGVVDPFVAKINSDSDFSLLRNPKMYTLRVATFGGKSAMENDKKKWDECDSKFQDAGIKAASLCAALRKKNIEAWEFHDHDCSFVTIGSFDSYGVTNPDGTIEMNPDIYKLMEKYRGQIVDSSGAYQVYSVQVEMKDGKARGKKVKMEIPFDLQPVIIMVPQLPENVKKVQLAQKQLQKTEEQTDFYHFKESAQADNDFFAQKYGSQTASTLSEGVVVTEDEIAQMEVSERSGSAAVSENSPNQAVSIQKQALSAERTQQTAQKTALVPQTRSDSSKTASSKNVSSPSMGAESKNRLIGKNSIQRTARKPVRTAKQSNAPAY